MRIYRSIRGKRFFIFITYFLICSSFAIALIPKDKSKWRDGIWIEFIDHINEHMIGTEKGIVKCRALRRKDETNN